MEGFVLPPSLVNGEARPSPPISLGSGVRGGSVVCFRDLVPLVEPRALGLTPRDALKGCVGTLGSLCCWVVPLLDPPRGDLLPLGGLTVPLPNPCSLPSSPNIKS